MTWDASAYGSHARDRVPRRDDVVLRRRLDRRRFDAVLPAAEPAADRRRRRCATCDRRPAADREDLHAAAGQPTTICVDAEGAGLASTDVSAVITAPAPIIAERAMYVNRPGQLFARGA